MTPAEARTVLGVSLNADPAQVQAAYRRLAMLLHPDRFPGTSAERRTAEDHLKIVNRAYEVLKRGGTDSCRPSASTGKPGPAPQGNDPEEARRQASRERQERPRREADQERQERSRSKAEQEQARRRFEGEGQSQDRLKATQAQPATEARPVMHRGRLVIFSWLASVGVAIVALVGFVTPTSGPTARGTVVVDASLVRSTSTSCVVAAWAADSVGPGMPVKILGSDEDQIGVGRFRIGDYPGGYYDETHTKCALDFEVEYTPGLNKNFYVSHGDYWSSELSQLELEEGVILTMPSRLNGDTD